MAFTLPYGGNSFLLRKHFSRIDVLVVLTLYRTIELLYMLHTLHRITC